MWVLTTTGKIINDDGRRGLGQTRQAVKREAEEDWDR